MLNVRRIAAGCLAMAVVVINGLGIAGCSEKSTGNAKVRTVPHEGRWGIYALNLSSQDVSLLYSTDDELAGIDLNNAGTRIAFAKQNQSGVALDTTSEIYVLDIGSKAVTQLTDNLFFDTYPSFSSDDSRIAFLSWRENTLDLYRMDSDGSHQQLLYNSGGHDGDVDWGNDDRVAFTRDNQIWTVDSAGTDPRQVTDPANAGQWGNANLPIGDYDPRISPDGHRIAFERMVDVSYVHGGYDIFTIGMDGSGEDNLTNTGSQGYAQGLASWSHAGDKLVYILSAIGSAGKYDLCLMKADGSDNSVVTPAYFPAEFLCHQAVFSLDDGDIYFIGQWWQ